MTNELTAREIQSRGGKARARNLSKERLKEIAALGGKARQDVERKRKKRVAELVKKANKE